MILDTRVKNSAQKQCVKQFDTCITFCDNRHPSVTNKKLTTVSYATRTQERKCKIFERLE